MQNRFKEFSLFRLQMDKQGNVSAQNSHHPRTFNPQEYSRFKYGDGTMTRHYAWSLANLLISQGAIERKTEYFLCGSAYQEAPTAANSIAKELTQILVNRGYGIKFFKIHSQAFVQDYSGLSLTDRGTVLSKIKLDVDPALRCQLLAKKVIFIDDIQITGLHKRHVQAFFSSLGIEQAIFGYIAVLNDRDGKSHPLIEWALNHSEINNLQKLSILASKDDFQPNARICKFILASSSKEIEDFIDVLPLETLTLLLAMMRADGYHTQPEYQVNFHTLSKIVNEKRVKILDKTKRSSEKYLSIGV